MTWLVRGCGMLGNSLVISLPHTKLGWVQCCCWATIALMTVYAWRRELRFRRRR